MGDAIQFSADVRPVGKQRPRLGKNCNTYTPKKSKRFETVIGAHARRERPRVWSMDERYRVSVEATYSDGRVSDIDNILKAVLDALNGIAYSDDRLVDELYIRREVADEDRVAVVVEVIEDE